jgi:MFS transporter, putative metabolite:H+ symporter
VLAGLGTGAESAIIAPFLAEFVPPARRGWFLGALAGFFSFGFVGAALIGRFVVPMSDSGWRWAQVVTAVPVLMGPVVAPVPAGVAPLPVAPRADGGGGAGRRRLRATRGSVPGHRAAPRPAVGGGRRAYRGDGPVEPGGPTGRDQVHVEPRDGPAHRGGVGAVVRDHVLLLRVLLLVPTLLINRGLTVTTSFSFSIIIYLAQVPGYFSAAWCNEKLDRRRTIAIYLVGSAISAFLLSQSDTSPTIVTSGALLSFFLNGVYAGLYAYTPEVFPTWVRSTATGMSSAFGRIGSITAPAIIGFFAAALGFAGVFTMTTAVLLVGVAVVLVFGLSTAGQSLEELSERRGLDATASPDVP